MTKSFSVVRQNRYARVLSFYHGAIYVVEEKVGNKWVDIALGHGSEYKPIALDVYKRLSAHKRR